MPLFIPDYELISVHKLILWDKIRTGTFCRATKCKTKKNSVVVDLGSGTGILSLAAARAGAKRVYSIERTGIAKLAKRLFANNDFQNQIRLIHSDSNYVNLSEKADLLVSEWIGVHVFQENMLPDFIDSRDRFLKPDGIVIPESVSIWLAPLRNNPIADDEILAWCEPIEGLDFSEIAQLSLNDTYIANIVPEDLAAPGQSVHTIDLYTVSKSESFRFSCNFEIETSQTINGICGWFIAKLAEGITLDTSPHSPSTHWCQTVYPVLPEIRVLSGENLEIEILFEPSREYVNISWNISVQGREKETFREFSTKNNYTLPGGNR